MKTFTIPAAELVDVVYEIPAVSPIIEKICTVPGETLHDLISRAIRTTFPTAKYIEPGKNSSFGSIEFSDSKSLDLSLLYIRTINEIEC